MSKKDSRSEDSATAHEAAEPKRGLGVGRWVTRIVIVLALIVAGYVAYKLFAGVAPRQWAQHIGRQVNGSSTKGTTLGLFYGFTFTLIPVLLLGCMFSRIFNWWSRLVLFIVAAALTTPNLLTLWVARGNSTATHAGDRIMDVNAPFFRWSTVWGAVAGLIVGLLIVTVIWRLGHRRRQVKSLKAELKARDEAGRDHPHGPAAS